MQAHSGRRGAVLLIYKLVLDESRWSMPHPSHFMPTNKPWYSLYRRLGRPWDWSGLVVEKTKSVHTGV